MTRTQNRRTTRPRTAEPQNRRTAEPQNQEPRTKNQRTGEPCVRLPRTAEPRNQNKRTKEQGNKRTKNCFNASPRGHPAWPGYPLGLAPRFNATPKGYPAPMLCALMLHGFTGSALSAAMASWMLDTGIIVIVLATLRASASCSRGVMK